MAGIDKIVSAIKIAADQEAEAIIHEAKSKAEDLIKMTEEECRIYIEEENQKSDKKVELAKSRYASQCDQEAKLIKLAAKQKIIENALNAAKAHLEQAEPAEYFKTLLGLLEKAVQKGEGEILLSEKDIKRLPSDFEAKAGEIAAAKGGKLKLAASPASIDSGFILRYGQIEENYSLTALFDENHDRLQDKVNEVLWRKDTEN